MLKEMKKRAPLSKAVLVLLLGLVLTFGLAGCGNQGDSSPSAAGSAGAEASAAQEEGSAAAEVEAVLPENMTVRDEDSRFFWDGSLGRWIIVPTYNMKDEEDVPYISAKKYITMIYPEATYSFENGILTITNNGSNATIDTEKNAIQIDDSSAFIGPNGEGAVGHGVVEPEEFDQIRASVKNQSTETESKPYDVDLNSYQLKAYAYGEDVLVPFLVLQNLFGAINFKNYFAYNGKDYYDVYHAEDDIDKYDKSKVKKPFIDAYYSGPFSKKATCSQAYADYAYYTTCLFLDTTFGHKEELGIDTFDAYFTKLKAKETMTSTNPADTMAVESMLIYYLFDSGHDAMLPTQGVYGRDTDMKPGEDAINNVELPENADPDKASDFLSQAIQTLGESDAMQEMIEEKGGAIPSLTGQLAWTIFMEMAKPKDYGNLRLDYSGDTAVIYFEAFKHDLESKFYLHPPTEKAELKSSFAFFNRCFKDIEKHKEVKNVVINLSNNGGGDAAALIAILGFLSPDGEAKFTSKELVSDKYREEYYHVDTNLDGVFDDKDGYGDKYDFFIMTSGSSYSCGTALPYLAQQSGHAKIMGCKPGGGDCVVASFIDAYGMHGVISGNMKIGTMTKKGFVSDEKAVKVDIKMMDSVIEALAVPWYDANEIAKKVRAYKKKAKN